jgi:hypothetical protein
VGCPEHLFTIGGGDYQPSQGVQAKLDWILRKLAITSPQGPVALKDVDRLRVWWMAMLDVTTLTRIAQY